MNEEQAHRLRANIVDKHIRALLQELEKAGQSIIGMAGGIVLAACSDGVGSMVHTFFMVHPSAGRADGTPFDGPSFVTDVAQAMINGQVTHSTQVPETEPAA